MLVLIFAVILLAAAAAHAYLADGPHPPDARSWRRFVDRVARNWLPLLLFLVAALGVGGALFESYGLPQLFRNDGDNFSSWILGILFSPPLWSGVALSMMVVLVFSGAYIYECGDTQLFGVASPLNWKGHYRYVLHHGAPFPLMILAGYLIYAGDLPVWVDAGLALLGLLIGFAGGLLVLRFCYWLAPVLAPLVQPFVMSVRRHLRYRDVPTIDWSISAAMLAFLIFQGLILLVVTTSRLVLTSIAILMLFGYVALAHFTLRSLRPALQVYASLFGAGLLLLANGVPLKHRFDELDALYPTAAPAAPPTLVDPVIALDAWRNRLLASGFYNDGRPPLVVLALSGGGYRSSFWSAVVIDTLLEASRDSSSELYGLMDHVRFVTGASGGLIAGGYFVAAPDQLQKPAFVEAALLKDTLEARYWSYDPAYGTLHPLARDSLSPVAQHIVQRDIWKLVIPGLHLISGTDRGEVLQRQWRSLQPLTFSSLRAGEADGWRPSLIASPMLADSGRQLLISNLDLPPGMVGVALADTFPATQDLLKLTTALRISATFPYVSPVIELPPPPRGRPVDAGYFDNFGIQAAIGLLRDPAVADWVQSRSSGVVIVRIDAFGADTPATPAGAGGWVTRALDSFGAPIGAVVNAQTLGPMARDTVSIEQLGRWYRERACPPSGPECRDDWVSVVSFRNRADAGRAAMSWYLSKRGLQAIEQQVNASHNTTARLELASIWQTLLAVP